MVERQRIGDRELELLRWLERVGGATVGEAAERYGVERGLARSTVLTMMERMRRKRQLRRREVDGVFRYSVAVPTSELARRAVRRFVDETLGGSLTPFVSYLAERETLDESQLAELEALLAKLRDRRTGESS